MKKKNLLLVTGCCGFIGSHLIDFLLKKKFNIIGIDNLLTGKKKFINKALKNKSFKFYKIDLLKKNINKYFKNVKIVFHLAVR